jgi:hypothetical protein
MTENRWKNSLAIESIERVGVGVADSGGLYFDEDLASLGALQVDLDNFKRLLGFECNSSAGLHRKLHLNSSNRCTDAPGRTPRMFA